MSTPANTLVSQPSPANGGGFFSRLGQGLKAAAPYIGPALNRVAAAFGNYRPLLLEQQQREQNMQQRLAQSTLDTQALNRTHLQQENENYQTPQQRADLEVATRGRINDLEPPKSEINVGPDGQLTRDEYSTATKQWSPQMRQVPNPALAPYNEPASAPKSNYVTDWGTPPPTMPKTVSEPVHPVPPAPMLGVTYSPAGIDTDPTSPTYGQSIQYVRSKMHPEQNMGAVKTPAGRGTLDTFAPTVSTSERAVSQPSGETTKEQFTSTRQRVLPGQTPKPLPSTGGTVIGGKAPKVVTDAYNKVLDADQRVKTMQSDIDQIAKNPANTGAFDMDLLSQHIALTFGTAKNVRGGEMLIEHHIKARSLPEEFQVMYNHLKNGGVLSPDQRANFLHLAQTRFATYQDQYRQAQDEAKGGFGMSTAPPTQPPVPQAPSTNPNNPLGLGPQ